MNTVTDFILALRDVARFLCKKIGSEYTVTIHVNHTQDDKYNTTYFTFNCM